MRGNLLGVDQQQRLLASLAFLYFRGWKLPRCWGFAKAARSQSITCQNAGRFASSLFRSSVLVAILLLPPWVCSAGAAVVHAVVIHLLGVFCSRRSGTGSSCISSGSRVGFLSHRGYRELNLLPRGEFFAMRLFSVSGRFWRRWPPAFCQDESSARGPCCRPSIRRL